MADNGYQRNYRSQGPTDRDPPGEPADPLTELARLIGQSDPFAVDPRAATPSRQPAPADWREPELGYDRRAAEPAPRYAQHESSFEREHDDYRPPEPGYPDEPRQAGGHYDYGRQDRPQHAAAPTGYEDRYEPAPPYRDEPRRPPFAEHGARPAVFERYPEEEGRAPFHPDQHRSIPDDRYEDDIEEEPPSRRRGVMMTAVAIVGIALVGTAGAFGYRAVFKSSAGAPPVIRAADAPNKIVPTTPGGDSAKTFADRLGPDRGQNEKVVSREEQPIDLSRAIASAQTPPPAVAPPPPAIPPASVTEPRRIRTVPIRADQGGDTRIQTPRPAAPRAGAPAPTSGTAPVSGGPLSLSPQRPAIEPPRPQPQIRTAAVPPAPAPAPAAVAGGGFFVQISAQKSEADAQAAFRVAQQKYASVLAGRQAVVRRKDLGAKGVFYGAQVGPFSKDEAVRLCEKLKAAGGTCMIQRN